MSKVKTLHFVVTALKRVDMTLLLFVAFDELSMFTAYFTTLPSYRLHHYSDRPVSSKDWFCATHAHLSVFILL